MKEGARRPASTSTLSAQDNANELAHEVHNLSAPSFKDGGHVMYGREHSAISAVSRNRSVASANNKLEKGGGLSNDGMRETGDVPVVANEKLPSLENGHGPSVEEHNPKQRVWLYGDLRSSPGLSGLCHTVRLEPGGTRVRWVWNHGPHYINPDLYNLFIHTDHMRSYYINPDVGNLFMWTDHIRFHSSS